MKKSLLEQAPGGRIETGPKYVHRANVPAHPEEQLSFADLGPNLIDVTFLVVDLETTGGRPDAHSITEFGAVKIRGGEVVGEFATLVNPGVPIPPQITILTGITTAMVYDAPDISAVMPSFVEFMGSDPNLVLVAHNAQFDVSHLKAAAAGLELPFPRVRVLDTVKLARRTFTRDEVPNYKLSSLARVVGASVQPTHRALDDARATVDVLHAMLARLGGIGITHLDDLMSATDPVPEKRRRKAHLTDGLPRGPGVYQFIGPRKETLYVGTSRNVYRRVRQYFTAAEKRKRMAEMVDLAVGVQATATGTILEANILELRLINQLDPPYNRRSRRTGHRPWLALTSESHPRLKLTRKPPSRGVDAVIGPFPSTSALRQASEVLTSFTGLRECTQKLPHQPDGRGSCHLYDLGRCSAPCLNGVPQEIALRKIKDIFSGNIYPVINDVLPRLSHLSEQERFEQAATERDRLYALVNGSRAFARIESVLEAGRIVAVARENSGWEAIVADHGCLRASARADRGENPETLATFLADSHPELHSPVTPFEHATIDEMRLICDWLWRSNVRLLHVGNPEALSVHRRGPLSIQLPTVDRSNGIQYPE